MTPGRDRDERPGAKDEQDAPTSVIERGEPTADGAAHARAGEPPPRLADGIELVGRYEDSGFKEAPCIARRSDGRMVQMPAMLYALAEVIDGDAREDELARRFSERIERQVEPDMVQTLLDEQLRPLGVVAARDGSSPEIEKVDPLLALKFRTRVVPKRAVRAMTTVFRPLFWPPVVVAVVLAFAAAAVWLFGVHGVSQSVRSIIYEPALVLLLLGGVVLATAFHELGHATATRYGGAEPGVMGVGVYIVWPAFYTDITDAYRLGKAGRLRADLGGMYFNAVFGLAVTALYAVTGFEALLLLVVLQTFAIVQQSLPLLRLDGYYIVSDLTGVPDMLSRIKPVLRSLLPGREPDPRVTELKPWVRRVVTGYVCTVVPLREAPSCRSRRPTASPDACVSARRCATSSPRRAAPAASPRRARGRRPPRRRADRLGDRDADGQARPAAAPRAPEGRSRRPVPAARSARQRSAAAPGVRARGRAPQRRGPRARAGATAAAELSGRRRRPGSRAGAPRERPAGRSACPRDALRRLDVMSATVVLTAAADGHSVRRAHAAAGPAAHASTTGRAGR